MRDNIISLKKRDNIIIREIDGKLIADEYKREFKKEDDKIIELIERNEEPFITHKINLSIKEELSRDNKNNNSINQISHFNSNDIELIWKDIDISVISSKKIFKLLENANGRVKSGECLAIVGSSGAGKTTMLNFLSQKIESKNLKIKGDYLLNGKKVNSNIFNSLSTYVMQNDILEPNLSPLEIIMFTAKMKLKMPLKDIESKVKKMINDLNLNNCQNTLIGSETKRGVSGGERKRTSIAVELILDPKIIFLDEPTTGLDSFNAFQVVSLLRKLASEGKIIIFNIHQPSSEVFFLLDKICILALGKIIYFGSQNQCLQFFNSCKIPVPLHYNPFEHFIEMTNIISVTNPMVLSIYPELDEIPGLHHRYRAYIDLLSSRYLENIDLYIDKSPMITLLTQENKHKNTNKPILYEIMILVGRNSIINFRNYKLLFLRVMQTFLNAVLIAILFISVIIF